MEAGTINSRLSRLAGVESLGVAAIERLGVLAALHDFGKANRGFQERWAPNTPPVGHVAEAWAALGEQAIVDRLSTVFPIEDAFSWGGFGPIVTALGHHGFPLDMQASGAARASLWRATPRYDPIAALAPLGAAIRGWFPAAFTTVGKLPTQPRFWHLVSGLLTLADWIASDEARVPLSPVGDSEGEARFARMRAVAPELLKRIGFDPRESRRALPAIPSFSSVSPHAATAVQEAAGEIGNERIVVLESETGSGKTEAALLRFARLFHAGAVDGLYVALPTRVAATALHHRVVTAAERLWPDAQTRPAVVLAVPGQMRLVDAGLGGPAGGVDRWADMLPDVPWAATRPKRFLAGTIAVGTIDQALLAIVKAKHAHLRLAGLSRHLLLVDEVHASDLYMEKLLTALLSFHKAAGGHALLLSATLGARARAQLLGAGQAPPLSGAVAAPYPALSRDTAPEPRTLPRFGREKVVRLTQSAAIDDPDAVARTAAQASRAGAKVLVVRNTRRAAVATFTALRRHAPDAPVFTCNGVPTLHHGRFTSEDRALLDAAIEAQIGKTRPEGGLVVIGTQTLEQSLDIDADVLITDLCPADVLLQRIGRLHRHARPRPPGYEAPRALVLSPSDLARLIGRPAHGLGARDACVGPYPDLVGLEATRRLIVAEPVWTIPAMNRRLVELTTHPEALETLAEELALGDASWQSASDRTSGRAFAHVSEASRAILRTDLGFADQGVVFSKDDPAATRLGAKDLLIELVEPAIGPFGAAVQTFALPDYWCRDIDPAGDLTPAVSIGADGALRIAVQGRTFSYDSQGMRADA